MLKEDEKELEREAGQLYLSPREQIAWKLNLGTWRKTRWLGRTSVDWAMANLFTNLFAFHDDMDGSVDK